VDEMEGACGCKKAMPKERSAERDGVLFSFEEETAREWSLQMRRVARRSRKIWSDDER
jgi:hypothetical protein